MKVLLAGLVGLLLCCAFGAPASAQDAQIFKLLKLEGSQVRWRLPRDGQPLSLTYTLVTDSVEFRGARNCRKITRFDDLLSRSDLDLSALQAELAAAFAMWEAAANVRFREAPEGARPDILIGAQVEPEGWAFAEVFYDLASPEPVKPISRALVCLNPLRRWKIGFDGDLKRYDLRYTFAHEIGHAIGLDHPSGGDQIMGYRYEERFRSLQAGDVRGVVALYGAARVQLGQPDMNAADASSSSAAGLVKRGTRSFNASSP